MAIHTAHPFTSFSWIDLCTADHQVAQAFYGGLMGWQFDDQIFDGQYVYTMCSLDGKLVAGMGEPPNVREGGTAPFWNPYVCVESVEHTIALCESAGGSVQMPAMEVFDSGVMAMVRDPAGASLSLWQPRNHAGYEVQKVPGALFWLELHSSNVARAQDFYATVFGWDTQDAGMESSYTLFVGSQLPEENRYPGSVVPLPTPNPAHPSQWFTYFQVADFQTTLDRAAALGATHIQGGDVMQPTGSKSALLADPLGAQFVIMQPN